MGLADFRSGNKVKRKSNFSPEVKSLVNLLKVVGVGNAHKYFPFMQSHDSQTACRLAAGT